MTIKILTVSGSISDGSSNARLLDALPRHFSNFQFEKFDLAQLPLFRPGIEESSLPSEVIQWRAAVAAATAVVFSTPEYLHNMPAVLKNALEWLTKSGELYQKPTIALTYTPQEPRGAKAMQSLLWSLVALDSKVLVSLPLYQTTLKVNPDGSLDGAEALEMLGSALDLIQA